MQEVSNGLTNLISIKFASKSLLISSERDNIEPKLKIEILFVSENLISLDFQISISSNSVGRSVPNPTPLGYLTAAGPSNL